MNEAGHLRAFWLILLCVGIPSLVNTGLTFHLVSILGESGLKTTTAAMILSLNEILLLIIILPVLGIIAALLALSPN